MNPSDDATAAEQRRAQEERVLRRAEKIAELFDERFRLPGTSFRFGYDAIIGFVPIVGDSIGFLISLYPILEALRLRIGFGPIVRMLLNITIDWLVGLIPFADLFLDAAYKANTKNLRILRGALRPSS